jgi:hypothetical protein
VVVAATVVTVTAPAVVTVTAPAVVTVTVEVVVVTVVAPPGPGGVVAGGRAVRLDAGHVGHGGGGRGVDRAGRTESKCQDGHARSCAAKKVHAFLRELNWTTARTPVGGHGDASIVGRGVSTARPGESRSCPDSNGRSREGVQWPNGSSGGSGVRTEVEFSVAGGVLLSAVSVM